MCFRYIAQFISTDGKGMAMLNGKDSKSSNCACEICESNRNRDLVVETVVSRDNITFRNAESDAINLERFKELNDYSQTAREECKGCVADSILPTPTHLMVPNGMHIGVHLQKKGYNMADENALYCDERLSEIAEENDENLYSETFSEEQKIKFAEDFEESIEEVQEHIKEMKRMLSMENFSTFNKDDIQEEIIELEKEHRKLKSHMRRISCAFDRVEGDETSVYKKLTSLRKSFQAQGKMWGMREVLNGNQAKNFTNNYRIFAKSWEDHLNDDTLSEWHLIFLEYMRLTDQFTHLFMKAEPLSAQNIRDIFRLAMELERLVKTNLIRKITGRKTKAFYGSWKYHKAIIHIPEFVAMWGCMGMLDEQSIESMHQVCNTIMRVICNLTRTAKMKALVRRQRLYNIPSAKHE